MGSKHVAVWILLKVVFGGYFFIPYFIELHNIFNYPAIIQQISTPWAEKAIIQSNTSWNNYSKILNTCIK
jgi:hypothetical protein